MLGQGIEQLKQEHVKQSVPAGSKWENIAAVFAPYAFHYHARTPPSPPPTPTHKATPFTPLVHVRPPTVAQGHLPAIGEGQFGTMAGEGQFGTVAGEGQFRAVNGEGQFVTVAGEGNFVTVNGEGQFGTVGAEKRSLANPPEYLPSVIGIEHPSCASVADKTALIEHMDEAYERTTMGETSAPPRPEQCGLSGRVAQLEPSVQPQPTQPVQPLEPTEPVAPTQHSAQPTQPGQPTQSDHTCVQPTQPGQSVEPTQPVEPTKPVKPTQPVEPVEPVELVEAGQLGGEDGDGWSESESWERGGGLRFRCVTLCVWLSPCSRAPQSYLYKLQTFAWLQPDRARGTRPIEGLYLV